MDQKTAERIRTLARNTDLGAVVIEEYGVPISIAWHVEGSQGWFAVVNIKREFAHAEKFWDDLDVEQVKALPSHVLNMFDVYGRNAIEDYPQDKLAMIFGRTIQGWTYSGSNPYSILLGTSSESSARIEDKNGLLLGVFTIKKYREAIRRRLEELDMDFNTYYREYFDQPDARKYNTRAYWKAGNEADVLFQYAVVGEAKFPTVQP